MKRKIFRLIFCGSHAMNKKLRTEKNKTKEGFENIPLEYLNGRMKDEQRELDQELYRSYRDYEAIKYEAIDIAAFGFIIAYNCTIEITKRKWNLFLKRVDKFCDRIMFR